jgi:hypothetical protein
MTVVGSSHLGGARSNEPTVSSRSWKTAGARTRLAVMIAVGVAAAVVTGLLASWTYAAIAG